MRSQHGTWREDRGFKDGRKIRGVWDQNNQNASVSMHKAVRKLLIENKKKKPATHEIGSIKTTREVTEGWCPEAAQLDKWMLKSGPGPGHIELSAWEVAICACSVPSPRTKSSI